MRLCRFFQQGQPQVGFYDEKNIVPLGAAGAKYQKATGDQLTLPSGDHLLDFLPPGGEGNASAVKLADWCKAHYDAVVAELAIPTQQAELLETENWFRGIIETAPDGMLVIDERGTIMLANPQAESIFGYAPGELVGASTERLLPEAMRNEHADLRQAFVAEGRNREMGESRQLHALRKDGSEVPIRVSLSLLPARGNRGKCVSASVRIVSEN